MHQFVCQDVVSITQRGVYRLRILFEFGKTVQVISIVAEMECVLLYNIVAWYTSVTPRGDAGRQPAHSGGAGVDTLHLVIIIIKHSSRRLFQAFFFLSLSFPTNEHAHNS